MHNGKFILATAEKLGRELTKDEIIGALDCLAHEAKEDVRKYASELQTLCDAIMGGENTPAPFRMVKEQLDQILSENADAMARRRS